MLFIDSSKIKSFSLPLLAKYKKTTLIMAITLLLCSLACLIFPLYSGVAVSNIAGMLFVICGIFSISGAFVFLKQSKRSFISSFIFGVIYLIMGYGFVISPVFGINTLSMIFCCLFIFGGLSRITAGYKNPQMNGRYWCIFIGLLDFAIAFIWLSASTNANFVITTTFIGLEMLFCSWFFFTLSYGFKQAHKELTTA